VMHIAAGQISSPSLGNLLRCEQELSGMSTLIVSNFTSSPFSSMEFIDLDVNTVAPSFIRVGSVIL
jgi:hypothetical protein